MKRFLIPILGLAVVGGLYTAGVAAADQIYISNHLYTGRAVKESGTAWLSLDDFVKASGMGPSALPHTGIDNGQIQVTFNGRKFSVPAETRADGVYVDARRLVEGMGGRWIFNSSLGLTDVALPAPQHYRPVATGPGAPTTVPPGSPAIPTPDVPSSPVPPGSASPAVGSKTKSPLKISKFSYIDPTLPGNFSNVQVRGSVTIDNVTEDYVDGIDIIVHIQDGYENDLATVTHQIDRLDGGKSITWEWTWNNSTALLFHPVVEVQCNPLISKADRERMAKEHTAPPEAKKISIRSGPTEGVPSASATTGGVGGQYDLPPTYSPTAAASSFAAPTETAVPPGFNPGQESSTAAPTASAAPTNPPGF